MPGNLSAKAHNVFSHYRYQKGSPIVAQYISGLAADISICSLGYGH